MTSEFTKDTYRQRIWSFMESNKLALYPRPAFNRIPNYKGADQASNKVKKLSEFQTAGTIKVDPDKSLEHIRYLTLEANKILLVPTPRLKSGLLNKITPPLNTTKHGLHMCATSEGVRHHSMKIGLNSKIKIDLVIVGSVAVSIAGQRIGKGEGYSDIEFAMMASMGAVNCDTPVITIVHDCQVLQSIPDALFKAHDVPVDIIVTPTKVIRCQPKLKKPDHIIWPLLTEEKMSQIPILRIFKSMEEKERPETNEELMYQSPPASINFEKYEF